MSNTISAQTVHHLATLVAAVALTACGGGGGSTPAPGQGSTGGTGGVVIPPAPPPPPASAPAPAGPAFIPSTIRTQARAATYPAGSLNRRVFDLLNGELSRCGFGFLYQDTRLDRAAKAHGDWMALNNQYTHIEDGARFPNGFTGTDPSARARFQGYPSGAGEDLAATQALYGDAANEAQNTEIVVRQLLAAPFHLGSLAASANDVGIAVTRAGDVVPNPVLGRLTDLYVTIMPASIQTQTRQDISSQEVATFPCEGSTSVFGAVLGEEPNPVPGRDLLRSPIGNGVLIRTNLISSLTVTSYTIVETGTTTPLRVLAPIEFRSSKLYFTDLPLKRGTRYTVTTSGTADGVPFRKNFTFTTGNFH